ncbi:hypothetical protein A3K73_09195 [Candidatus Pacearchaeota archaeon RBG_13_36_9]|nr:MAG: hypothetical protein A3K73_09195 [Candidatus Pacearchaeota archaeon RBG_13_36_9]
MRKKFLRGKWRTYSKLGRGRKSKQKYRKAKGRHNKIREKLKGNPILVAIGYKKPRKEKAETRIIHNLQELADLKKGESVILAKIGQKSKLKIAEKAEEKEIKILNLNIRKFIKRVERKKKEKQLERKGKEEKKTKEKKAKPKKEEKEKPKEGAEKQLEKIQENKK